MCESVSHIKIGQKEPAPDPLILPNFSYFPSALSERTLLKFCREIMKLFWRILTHSVCMGKITHILILIRDLNSGQFLSRRVFQDFLPLSLRMVNIPFIVCMTVEKPESYEPHTNRKMCQNL